MNVLCEINVSSFSGGRAGADGRTDGRSESLVSLGGALVSFGGALVSLGGTLKGSLVIRRIFGQSPLLSWRHRPRTPPPEFL